jgi:hypothetical protein
MSQEPVRLVAAEKSQAGAWIEKAVWDWTTTREVTVGAIVPEGFDAYARVFHPIRDPDTGQELRWAAVATRSGHQLQPDSAFGEITDIRVKGFAPQTGSLPQQDCRALVDILARYTRQPDDCWFAIWLGYQLLAHDSGLPESGVIMRTPEREFGLYQGPLDGAMTFHRGSMNGVFQSPSIWWPGERAWCIGTDVDLESTYVGGSRECIDAIVASPHVEAAEVAVEFRVDELG